MEYRRIEYNGAKFELRPKQKGAWKWYHLFLPVFMWLVGIFARKMKQRWYKDYWTVVPVPFTDYWVCYGPPDEYDDPSDVLLGHEARHYHSTNGLLYVLWPWYRLDEELYAYEVNMVDQVNKYGRVTERWIDWVVNALHGMYFLWPVMSKRTIRNKVMNRVARVELRMEGRNR